MQLHHFVRYHLKKAVNTLTHEVAIGVGKNDTGSTYLRSYQGGSTSETV